MTVTAAQAAPKARVGTRKRTAKERRRALQGYALLSPWLIGFFLFTFVPILASITLSFTKYSALRPPEFIGLKNYRTALTGEDPLVWSSIARTFYFAFLSVPLSLTGSLLVAVLLNQQLNFTAIWRTFFFLPTLTPTVASAYIWRLLLNPDIGMLNYLLNRVGLPSPPRWFGTMEWVIPALAMIGLWGSVGGSSMIIFLAGLQDVPVELIEAAEIDGAGTWRKFWSITLPMLSPVIFFNLVMGIIRALRVFDVAFIATAGGPSNASRFISLHIYQTAFVRYEMGYAAALAWILVVIIVTLTILQFRLSGRWVFYQGETRS